MTEGDDLITGTDNADTLKGAGGNDTIKGAGGNDLLDGGSGDDVILGQDGIDTLLGGDGDDTLNLGPVETAFGNGAQVASANGGNGVDTLTLPISRAALEDTTDVVNPIFQYTIGDVNNQGATIADIEILQFTEGFAIENIEIRLGTAGADVLQAVLNLDSKIIAGRGNDTIKGAAQDDEILAVTSAGSDGDKTVFSYDGRDSVSTGDGADNVLLGAGNDSAFTGENNDTIFGEAGNDFIFADDGNDSLIGGSGGDQLLGSNGQDTLIGGTGVDTLAGGSGADLFIYAAGDGNDRINDFTAGAGAGDVIDLSGMGANFNTFQEVLAATSDSGSDAIISFGGGDTLRLVGVSRDDLVADDFAF
ncbi:MAG: calcium-binding protein [Pseudomonadota bacterium]